MKSNKRVLLKNTVMLYLLKFSTYFLSLITVPYETRVLGVEKYGLIGVAAAIMTYAQLAIDFGFLLSATQEVSLNREDNKKVSSIFTSVTVDKIVLATVTSLAVSIILGTVEQWRENFLFFILYLIAAVTHCLVPDFLYRGLEKMEAVTVRTVLIRVFSTAMIFVFVKSPEDVILIPILQIIGNVVALLLVYVHLHCRLGISFVKVNFSDLVDRFKLSSVFFLSRIASTVYTVANTIILDLLSAGSMTAYYSSADKIVTTGKNAMSPVADSLYPYMMRNKDFKLVKKILLIMEPIIIVGCTVVFIWATPLCMWFFGDDFADAAGPLRALLPVVAITLPNYIMGFPVLGAMKLNKHANYSVMLGSILHVVNLLILFFTSNINFITLGISTSITEFIVLLYRCIVVYKYRHLMKKQSQEESQGEETVKEN